MLEAEAKERQRAHGGTAPGKPKEESLVPLVEQVIEPTPRSIEAAAKAVGVNKQYVSDMKTIAREAPEKVEQIRSINRPDAEGRYCLNVIRAFE